MKEGFKLPEDGLYSGFDAATGTYDKTTWNYEEGGDMSGKTDTPAAAPQLRMPPRQAGRPAGGACRSRASTRTRQAAGTVALPPNVAYDLTLQHPRCVFQLMKQQYSRYTPEIVERITGIPKDQYLKAIDMFTSVRKDGDMKKVATIIYAVGWTQHTFGTQIIRTAAMIQLLLGNVGSAGGGVNALRGHSNIQGATDMAGLYDSLPGYLKAPVPADTDLATFLKRITPTSSKPTPWDSRNYYSNTPKFFVSLMKAMYGDAATKENGLLLRLLAESGSRLFVDAYLGRYVQRQSEGHVGVRNERRDDRPGHE